MKSRLLSLFLVVGAAAIAACGKDPFAITPTLENLTDTIVVYALNGSAPDLPTGINTPFAAAARVDSSFNFDVALDLDDAGEVVVLPIARVASSFGISRRVGLAFPTQAFDSVTKAPASGYVVDSARTVAVGHTVVVQAASPFCQLQGTGSSIVYSKFVVDSVNLAQRALHVRITADRTCGYRSFLPGFPKS